MVAKCSSSTHARQRGGQAALRGVSWFLIIIIEHTSRGADALLAPVTCVAFPSFYAPFVYQALFT